MANKHIKVWCLRQGVYVCDCTVFYWKLLLLREQFHYMMRQFYICEPVFSVRPNIREMTTLMCLSGQWPELHSFLSLTLYLFIYLFMSAEGYCGQQQINRQLGDIGPSEIESEIPHDLLGTEYRAEWRNLQKRWASRPVCWELAGV